MVKVALWVRLEAKPGREADVDTFLRGGLALVQDERTERQKVARPWYEHRLCVAAIDLEAGRSTGGASLLVPGAAFAALTAAPSAKGEHRIPCLKASGLQILSCIGS